MTLTDRRPIRSLPRNVWVVSLTSFLTDISSEMLYNLLPIFLFNVLGVRTAFIGLIEGVAEATASLLKAAAGWLSDRVRQRKRLAVIGYALSTLAKPLLYLVTSWMGVLLVRFLDRAGKGMRTAPRDALIADSVQDGDRGLAFGLHRAGDTAGAVLGLLAAFLLLRASPSAGLELTRSSFQIVVVASVIPAILAVLVLALGAREIVGGGAKPETFSLGELGGRYRWFLLVMAVFTLGNSSDAFLILRGQTLGLVVLEILGMMILFNLVYAALSTPAGALSDRFSRRRVLAFGMLLFAVVYLGFARAQEKWHVFLLMGGYGLYYGVSEGVARAFVADMVPATLRGTAYGIYHATLGVMSFAASLIAGILWQGIGQWEGFGPRSPFLFGTVMTVGALLLLLMMPTRDEVV
jgi:MFS family permease